MLLVEGQRRLLGSLIFLVYIQFTACALNDVSTLTGLFDVWPNLFFHIWTRLSGRRKGCFVETLDIRVVLGDGMGHVPHGPARRSDRGGEWAHTIREGKQEETERVFAETLQSQESKPCVWEGQLEKALRGLTHGSSQDGEGCTISGIPCKGPSGPVFLQLQNQCIALGPGEMTSLQGGVMACGSSTKHLHGEEQEIHNCRRHSAAGDRSLCLTT